METNKSSKEMHTVHSRLQKSRTIKGGRIAIVHHFIQWSEEHLFLSVLKQSIYCRGVSPGRLFRDLSALPLCIFTLTFLFSAFKVI